MRVRREIAEAGLRQDQECEVCSVLSAEEGKPHFNSLRKCKALGEKYYDPMYETRLGATGLYSSVKDAFIDAIAAAHELGSREKRSNWRRGRKTSRASFAASFHESHPASGMSCGQAGGRTMIASRTMARCSSVMSTN